MAKKKATVDLSGLEITNSGQVVSREDAKAAQGKREAFGFTFDEAKGLKKACAKLPVYKLKGV